MNTFDKWINGTIPMQEFLRDLMGVKKVMDVKTLEDFRDDGLINHQEYRKWKEVELKSK